MNHQRDMVEQESLTTELTIAPDGRVYVFGASRQMLEVLEVLGPNDARLKRLLNHVRQLARLCSMPVPAMHSQGRGQDAHATASHE